MSNDANDFLLGGGNTSARFENIGDTVTGIIASPPEKRQQTDLKDGKPLTWDDGSPRWQLVVTLQTEQRDPSDPDDDGKRNLYIKGSTKAGSRSIHDAVATAVRTAGGKGLEIGGRLTVTHDGTEPSETRGYNDRKLYSATYLPPDGSDFLGTDQPTTNTAAPNATAPAAPAAAPPAVDKAAAIAEARELITSGLDDPTIHAATGVDLKVIAALRNNAAA